jgi:hypothetical protein
MFMVQAGIGSVVPGHCDTRSDEAMTAKCTRRQIAVSRRPLREARREGLGRIDLRLNPRPEPIGQTLHVNMPALSGAGRPSLVDLFRAAAQLE